MPLGPLLLFGNQQAANPGASVVTLYCANPISSGASAGTLQTTQPPASTSTTGWTVGTTASGNYSRQSYGNENAAANFTTTVQPDGIPERWAIDTWRYGPISGQFSLGTWYSALSVIGVTSGGDQDGRARFRIWRSHFASGSTQSAVASDDFNRANENPLVGIGRVWTTISGQVAMQVVSNQCTPTAVSGTDNGAYYSGANWPADQFSRANLTVNSTGGATQGVCLMVRVATGAATFYRFVTDHAASNNCTLSRFNGGVSTTLVQFTQAWTDGNLWEFQVRGPTLIVLLEGSVVQVFNDTAPLLSGSPGLGLSTTVTSAAIDNWVGGAFTGATEITNGTMVGAAVTNLSTTVAQSSAASQRIVAFPVANEYLFLQAAWETTGAGGAVDRDVLIRLGSMGATDGSGLVTAAFATSGAPAGVLGGGAYFQRRKRWDAMGYADDL